MSGKVLGPPTFWHFYAHSGTACEVGLSNIVDDVGRVPTHSRGKMRFVGSVRWFASVVVAAVVAVWPARLAIAAEPTTRPTAVLAVLGGDQETIYRGWPIRIELQNLTDAADAAPGPLKVSGPTQVDPQPAPHAVGLWVISPEKSKTMTAGNYVFSAAGVACKVAVEDEPMSCRRVSNRRSRVAEFRMRWSWRTPPVPRVSRGMGDGRAARSGWQMALGDVLAGSGKLPEAAGGLYRRNQPHSRPA